MTSCPTTQAVECLAEWALVPTNLVFRRISANVFDPRAVGDKAKWFAHELHCVRFSAFACDLDKWNNGLASVLRGLREHHAAADQEPATDESGSDSEAISTSSSCSSLRYYEGDRSMTVYCSDNLTRFEEGRGRQFTSRP